MNKGLAKQDCTHEDRWEYLSLKAGEEWWRCLDCGETIPRYIDCGGGC
jgi:hypothetical protein